MNLMNRVATLMARACNKLRCSALTEQRSDRRKSYPIQWRLKQKFAVCREGDATTGLFVQIFTIITFLPGFLHRREPQEVTWSMARIIKVRRVCQL